MNTNTSKKLIIPLVGVDNEHCAMIVRNGLTELDGAQSVVVEPNNGRAIIETSKLNLLEEAVKKIRDLGYDVPTVKSQFPVLAMTCASCAISVESMLKSASGVISASANFANATVWVEYVPNLTQPSELKRVVQSIGYDILIEDSREREDVIEKLHIEAYRKLRNRTIGSVIFSIPLVLVSMVFMDIPYADIIMGLLATPVILWFGRDFHRNAWKQLKNRSANMDTLVSLSTGVAYLFSMFNVLYPEFWISRGLEAHVYFESGAVVIAFILLGKVLEERAKGSTSSAIRKLMGMKVAEASRVKENGEIEVVRLEDVSVGDILIVKPGEQVAVDGEVQDGQSYVDESLMSGEPTPVLKERGARVYAGTMNQKGSFRFVAKKVGNDTMLSGIIQMIQQAQGSKAPVQRMVDKIAGIFVPVVIGISLLTLVSWIVFGGENGFTQGILSLVTVLVIACPCALGLATPTAIMVGIGKGAENGILIKDAESLELAKKLTTVVLDKTGTITEGRPLVTDEIWIRNEEHFKDVVFSIESLSEHPLADAVVKQLKSRRTLEVSAFQSITGKGVMATVQGVSYYVGNRKLMEENGIRIPTEILEMEAKLSTESKTIVWAADHGSVIAIMAIADRIKDSSVQAIHELKSMGIDVVMLTGDNEGTAKTVAERTGIQRYHAEVLPSDKAKFIRKLREGGEVVAMVGDGINDSTALAIADVSIAMGHGSDIAMDVAKMTIISSELTKIPEAIKLSRSTVAAIRQNLFWAFIYNLIGIPLAAGVLYPFFGFQLNPMLAGAAMALSSLSVVANSLRLKWRNYKM